MHRLNYHHLLYFFTVAREGSVARASARLGLAQPTVSAQIHDLENELGRKLLERSGRSLKVTPAGETVLRYAASIFAQGNELLAALDGSGEAAPALAAGVSVSLSPLLASVLLGGISELDPRPRLAAVCDTVEALAAKVAARALHFALTDALPPKAAARGLHSRVLLESRLALYAPAPLARSLGRDFPSRLGGADVAMSAGGALREEVERWLARAKIKVEIVAEVPHPEFHARAAGAAIFAPVVLREQLRKAHGLLPAGELEASRWRTYLVTAGKNGNLPALEAVVAAAKALG